MPALPSTRDEALAVDCPFRYCHAQPGEPCRTKRGTHRSTPHLQRHHAAAPAAVVAVGGLGDLSAVNREVHPASTDPSGGSRGGTWLVDRRKVTTSEAATAHHLLGHFNALAGTNYTSQGWHNRIIRRLREHPELSVRHHEFVVAVCFRKPWWRDPASPSVIWGNAELYEQNIERARAAARAARTTEPDSVTRAVQEVFRDRS